MVPPACKFAGLPAVAGWLRNVEQHRSEAPWCGAGARTRQELRQSTGGWGGTPSTSSVLDFAPRFTAFCRCSVLVSRAQALRLNSLTPGQPRACSNPRERVFSPSFRDHRFATEARFMTFKRLGVMCPVLLAVTAFTLTIRSQEKREAGATHKIVRSGDLKWTPIIKGCDLAAVAGDSNAEGTPFVLRIRCAEGARIPAHWHPTDENVTVLRGTFLVGMGEKFDESRLETMNPGNFISMPKEMRHFALSKTDTVVQVNATGPFKVNWVNPADVVPPDAPTKEPAKPKQ